MISIIIPIYNAEKFLVETIESILNQSYEEFELILVNDGSTDATDEICIAYAQKNDKIKYFKKENSGVSDTRNYGILKSIGEYLIFVDADDTLPAFILQNYMEEMKKSDADVIFSGYSYNYNGRLLLRLPRIKSGVYKYQELKKWLLDDGTLSGILFGSVCGIFYKRSVIVDNNVWFSKDVKVNEDGLFNINLLYYCNKIQVLNISAYNYRQWKEKKADKLQKDKRFDCCNKEIVLLLQKRGELSDFKKQLKCRQVSIAFWNAIRIRNTITNYKEAKKYLTDIFMEDSVLEGLKELDCSRMNRYKRVICKMIQKKSVFIFYFTIRYIVPKIEKFAKR